jgi:hypothetical protein
MPAYPIPPWLHPQDTVGPYVQAQRLRAEMDMQQQRLAAQQQMAAIESQVKKEQAEREAMLTQQRIAVSAQMQQQEADLKRQELEQAKEKIQQSSEAAARRYQAMAGYQAAIQGGADPLKSILEFGPAMGQQGTAEAAAIRASQMHAKQAVPPQWQTDPVSGQRYLWNPQSGAVHFPHEVKQGMTENQEIQQLIALRRDASRKIVTNPIQAATMIDAETDTADDKAFKAKQRKYQDDLKTTVEDYDKQIKDLQDAARTKRRQAPPGHIAVTKNGVEGYIPQEHEKAARGMPETYTFESQQPEGEEEEQPPDAQQP